MSPVAFAYSRARLQAHHGRRLPADVWRRLEAIGDFGQFVQAARSTALRPWVEHVGAQAEVHGVELALRERQRHHIHRVASWQPRPWRAACQWARVLVDLPALRHLLDGRPALAWMHRDPQLAPIAETEPRGRAQRLARTGWAPLVSPDTAATGTASKDRGEHALTTAWLAQWRRLWPGSISGAERRSLDRIVQRLMRARRSLQRGDLDRTLLERWLTRRFRVLTQAPAGCYLHLALVWLDVERLRGDLSRRALFARVD